MTKHRWFTLYPQSITVAAVDSDAAWHYVVENYGLNEIMYECEIVDTTNNVGQEDYLAELDDELDNR